MQYSDLLDQNRATYDSLAHEFQEKSIFRLPKDELIVDVLIKRTPLPGTMLDIGPGNGNMSGLLLEAGHQVTAVEISPEMGRLVHERFPTLTMIVDDFVTHDFGSTTFDGILAVAFIHLFPLEYTQQILEKIKLLLKSGGTAFISTTKHLESAEGFFEKHNFKGKSPRFRHRFTKEELDELIRTAGLQIVEYQEEIDDEEPEKIWMGYIVTTPATS